ncbi:hypothetical protein [Bacteroides sp. UBA939]|uniref:hypothetical protein n=1 Tax=Bacteroides sp. UBA939 TaxID=1946092 RepID=UPI0025BF7B9E|nr:hypothetical protein [Bacteroides sp. UBA939]
MKRILFIIISLFSVAGLQAQVTECMRIYTDKDNYLAGEELWIKVCVTDSAYHEITASKVAYVEISDTRQVHAQGKIALQNGVGWGHVRFPQTMHSGTYQLTAYTRYMRNQSADSFPKKYIAVLNADQATEEDNIEVLKDSVVMASAVPASDKPIASTSGLSTDKSVYGNRNKVTMKLPQLPGDIKELSVSVVRKDCVMPAFPASEYSQKGNPASGKHFIAECEGHIVTGRLVEAGADSIDARLSCVGKDIRICDGQLQPDGTYAFYTSGITDMQDIVLTALPGGGHQGRLELVSPFAEVLPGELPKLRVAYDEEALIERSIGAQLHHILPVDSTHNRSIQEQLHDFHPWISYNLDEYVRFNTVRETFIEFVLGLRVSKVEDKTIIRMLQEDIKRFSGLKALVLIDGVPIENHETVLDYNARLLHHIHQYNGRYMFGNKLYEGIVSLITHRGSLPGLRLDENSQLFAYEFPQNKPAFVIPVYDSEVQKKSRIPDFRHTLYWNPEITSATDTISFYTSDMKGEYMVTLQGITPTGEAIKIQSEFLVQ